MDSSQWRLLRSSLEIEIREKDLLRRFVDASWDRDTKKQVDQLLSKRAGELMKELNLPEVPKGHKLFAQLYFTKNTNAMKLSVFYVPWTAKKRGRTSNSSSRRPVSLPQKAEDPLGVHLAMMDMMDQVPRDEIHESMEDSIDGLMLPALRLDQIGRPKKLAQAGTQSQQTSVVQT